MSCICASQMKDEEGQLIHVPMEVLVYINRLPSDFKKSSGTENVTAVHPSVPLLYEF